jgi:uncharacterized protein
VSSADWLKTEGAGAEVTTLWNMCRVILGGDSKDEVIGNNAPGYLFVDTDGTIGGLDVLSICEPGLPNLGRSVFRTSFDSIDADQFHGTKKAIFGQSLPQACKTCPEAETCAGGHLPHRYSRQNGFDNPSVWCKDLLKLFGHIRSKLHIDITETAKLRAGYLESKRNVNTRMG